MEKVYRNKLKEGTNVELSTIDHEVTVAGYYILNAKDKLGCGGFGEIYSGVNTIIKKDVAIKLEDIDTEHPQVFSECELYIKLQGGSKLILILVGIPLIHWCGIQGKYNILIIDKLGPSLEDLFDQNDRLFSLKTVLLIADQMVSRIEYLHSKSFIHRDIKPDNFLIGLGDKKHIIHMIDLGLAKRFKDSKGRHIPYCEGKGLSGTARYSSLNTHAGIQQSRRDDLESLAYVLIYLIKGSLPWMGIRTKKIEDKYHKIWRIKHDTPIEVLCSELPEEFKLFLQYVRSLEFKQRPDYNYLRDLIKAVMIRENFENDSIFDWSDITDKKEEF